MPRAKFLIEYRLKNCFSISYASRKDIFLVVFFLISTFFINYYVTEVRTVVSNGMEVTIKSNRQS